MIIKANIKNLINIKASTLCNDIISWRTSDREREKSL
jgi:hypothetical protein